MNLKFKQLTGLRFFAAIGVVICHYAKYLQIPSNLIFLSDFFGSLVFLFFILSGFILTIKYQTDFLTNVNGINKFRNYAISRIARIFPVYLLVLMVTLISYQFYDFRISLGGDSNYASKVSSFFVNAIAIQAWIPDVSMQQYWNAPGWSISSEIFFYFSLPFLLIHYEKINGLLRLTSLILLPALAVVAVLLVSLWLGNAQAQLLSMLYLSRSPIMGIFAFCLGVVLGIAHLRNVRYHVGRVQIVIIAVLVLSLAWSIHYFHRSFGDTYYYAVLVIASHTMYSLFYFKLLIYLNSSSVILKKILSGKILESLGHASYSLYLIHWLPLCLITYYSSQERKFDQGHVVAIISCLVLVSVFIYRYYEQPMRLLTNRLRLS